ncbi:MAG TPA: DUF3467 domain-containing protein [Myxococcales bacterium]|nr:DUF3467 domain-containing protein [Myxococcales bacterium]
MTSKKKPEGSVSLQIQLDEDTAQGSYANLVMLNHTETEFVFDFIYVQPQQPKAKVRSRIICSPRHAKQLLGALSENIGIYEERFGNIKAAKGEPPVMH